MNRTRIAGSVAVVAVSLGFVCPQLAQIRAAGSLPPVGILLLLLGIAGMIVGVWCGLQGIRREASKPTS
jgi:hypothetical protein